MLKPFTIIGRLLYRTLVKDVASNIQIYLVQTLGSGETMDSPFIVRKYQDRDKEECRSLWRELTDWHREIYQTPDIGGEHSEKYFDKHLHRIGSDNLWVAVCDSRVVGLVGLIVGEGEVEIEPLVVNKDYRHRGIGTHLIETVIAETRNRGVAYLDVKPVARNVSTIRFLHKLGFRKLGHIGMCYGFRQSCLETGITIHEREFEY